MKSQDKSKESKKTRELKKSEEHFANYASSEINFLFKWTKQVRKLVGLLTDCDVREALRRDKAEKFKKFFIMKDAVEVPVLNVFIADQSEEPHLF